MSVEAVEHPLDWLRAQPQSGSADPARWAVLEGLARRAEQAPAALRELLMQRLRARRQVLQARAAAFEAPRRDSALAPLLLTLTDRGELQTLQIDRRSWTRLRLERRLAEPMRAPAPAQQLGPLHAQAIVPRALETLRELSPEYLQQLLAQLDGLAMLEPLVPAETAETRAPKRTAARKRG